MTAPATFKQDDALRAFSAAKKAGWKVCAIIVDGVRYEVSDEPIGAADQPPEWTDDDR